MVYTIVYCFCCFALQNPLFKILVWFNFFISVEIHLFWLHLFLRVKSADLRYCQAFVRSYCMLYNLWWLVGKLIWWRFTMAFSSEFLAQTRLKCIRVQKCYCWNPFVLLSKARRVILLNMILSLYSQRVYSMLWW